MKLLFGFLTVIFLSGCTSTPSFDYIPGEKTEAIRVLEPMNTVLHFVTPGIYERIGTLDNMPMYSATGVKNGGYGSPAIGLIQESSSLCIITQHKGKVCKKVKVVKTLIEK